MMCGLLSRLIFQVLTTGPICRHAEDLGPLLKVFASTPSDEPTKAQQSGWHVNVVSPQNDVVYSVDAQSHGSFDYYATAEGIYTVCFKNDHSEEAALATAKITVGDPPDLVQLAKTEHLSPIEERIKNLHESMNAVRGALSRQTL